MILNLSLTRNGKTYDPYIEIICAKTDPLGRRQPVFSFNTSLQVIEITSRVITLSKGKIIFLNDSIKIDFSADMVMFYLNYSWKSEVGNPLEMIKTMVKGNGTPAWNSSNFRSLVKGNFISPNICTEFNNATGNVDFLRSENMPDKNNGLLWTRLHNKELDLAYSLVHNGTNCLHSSLTLMSDNRIIEFHDVDYQVIRESVSSASGMKYPGNIRLKASNEDYYIIVDLNDQEEILERELLSETNFLERLTRPFSGRKPRYRTLKLHAHADVKIIERMSRREFSSLTSISEFMTPVR